MINPNDSAGNSGWRTLLQRVFLPTIAPFQDSWNYEVKTFRFPGPPVFTRLAIIWDILKMVPVQIFSVCIGWLLLLKMEQGRDFFTMLQHPFQNLREDGWQTFWHFFFFWLAIVLWALFLWFSARVMLQLLKKTRQFQAKSPELQQRTDNYVLYWQRWIPRLLGAIPFLIALIGFSGEGAKGPMVIFSLTAFTGLIFIVSRYRLMGLEASDQVRFNKKNLSFNSMQGADKVKFWVFVALSIALGLICCLSASIIARIGSAAIATASFAVFTAWASSFSFLQQKTGVPVFVFLLVLALVCTQYNNNHYIIPKTGTPPGRHHLNEHFQGWIKERTEVYPEGDSTEKPLYILAVEGGGIRGLNWTARVLQLLSEKDPQFYKKVYAVAGASGGMLGASFYQAYQYGIDSGWVNPNDRAAFNNLLTRDYLSNALAAYLFPEFLQYALPWPMPGVDRAKWFEGSIQNGFEDLCKPELPEQKKSYTTRSFLDMYPREAPFRYPAFFINGAVVETGQRATYSNIIIEEKYFPNTLDIHHTLQSDVQISTAMTFCCRFPYVLPPATLRDAAGNNKANIVDGGYFENTGIKTCLEILDYFKFDANATQTLRARHLKPIVIFIKNGATDIYRDNPAMPEPEDYSDFLLDWLAPPKCLINQWNGISINWIDEAVKRSQAHQNEFDFYILALNRNVDVRIPLGYCMSVEADAEIRRQIQDLKAGTVNQNREVELDNQCTLNHLFEGDISTRCKYTK